MLAKLPHRILLTTLILLSGTTLLSQTTFVFTDSACQARMKRDVYVLASDSFQGRMSGSAGERKAYEYLIRQLTEAGVPPAGAKPGSYLQPFPFTEPQFDWPKTTLFSGDKKFIYRLEFGVTAYSSTGAVSAPVVDVGYGLELPGYDNYTDAGDVAGKLVIMNLQVPRKLRRNDTLSNTISPKARILLAMQKGATGVLFYNSNSSYYKGLFDFDHIDTLSIPVIWVNSNIEKWIRKHPADTAKLTIHMKRKVETFHNLVGYIDNQARQTVILGAHYDHMGVGKRTGLIKHGADDNASGTAMVTELARWLASGADKQSNYLILLFSGEEEWLKGSYYFTAHPTVPFDNANFMFNFDMEGRLGAEGNRIDALCVGTSPDWRRIFHVPNPPPFKVRKIEGAGEFSDHYPFYIKGIPTAYLTTGMHFDYHTSRDVASKINYPGMTEVLKLAKQIIEGAEMSGKVRYRKVAAWKDLNSKIWYVKEQLEYLFHAGMAEMD